MTSENSIHVTRHFTVPAETVFDAWLDQRTAGQWLFATPTGQMLRVEIDPRVGGKYIVTERRPEGDTEHTGQFMEMARPTHLVMSFAVPRHSDESTTVTIDITPNTDGCDLTLSHGGVVPQYAERTMDGWAKILDGLARTLHSA